MLGLVLDVLFAVFIARAAWKLIQGFMEGYTGQAKPPGRGGSIQSVHMSRDPVCGTYVIPNSALAITEGSRQVFFCSASCRDRYRTKRA